MKIGYARVSTSGQSLDRQIDSLREAGCERIYSEKVSAVKKDRPELDRMMDALREGDVVIVSELTRLGRSVKELIDLVERIHTTGADIISLQEPWMDTTSKQGVFIFNIFAAFAQCERDLTRQRVLDGLEAAKLRGRKGGRPTVPTDMAALAIRMHNNSCPIADIIKATGISKTTIYRLVNNSIQH